MASWSLYYEAESFRRVLTVNLRSDLVDRITDAQVGEPTLSSDEIAERL